MLHVECDGPGDGRYVQERTVLRQVIKRVMANGGLEVAR